MDANTLSKNNWDYITPVNPNLFLLGNERFYFVDEIENNAFCKIEKIDGLYHFYIKNNLAPQLRQLIIFYCLGFSHNKLLFSNNIEWIKDEDFDYNNLDYSKKMALNFGLDLSLPKKGLDIAICGLGISNIDELANKFNAHSKFVLIQLERLGMIPKNLIR